MKMNDLIESAFLAIEAENSFVDVLRLTTEAFLFAFENEECGVNLQLHPLGFLALVWPLDELRVLRLHYWQRSFSWGQSKDLHIHDHTFSFKSAVLLGAIRNDIYSVRSGSEGKVLYLTAYEGKKSVLHPQKDRVIPLLESSEIHEQGAIYSMPKGVLHQTQLESTRALTALAARYGSTDVSGARVLGDVMRDGSQAFKRAVLGDEQCDALLASIADAFMAAGNYPKD